MYEILKRFFKSKRGYKKRIAFVDDNNHSDLDRKDMISKDNDLIIQEVITMEIAMAAKEKKATEKKGMATEKEKRMVTEMVMMMEKRILTVKTTMVQ